MSKNVVTLFLISIYFIFTGCKEKTGRSISKIPPAKIAIDTIQIKEIEHEQSYQGRFHFIYSSNSIFKKAKKHFSDDELSTILALNRIDINRMYRVKKLIIPDSIYTNFMNYAPFPSVIAELVEIKKLIVISYPIQAFALYESGRLIVWGPTSMGKKSSPTPIGLFHTNWKAKKTISTVNEEWILKWYFNIVNLDGISMHEYELPGYPASHSCIRLRVQDAKFIYVWADQWIVENNGRTIIANGTPVIIYGNYDFDNPPPWYKLENNPNANKITADSLLKIITPYYQVIIQEQSIRDSIAITIHKITIPS